MSGGVWKAVETGVREVGVGKTEGRRSKGAKRGEEREEREEEKPEEGEDSGSEKSGRGMGNMG